MASNCSSRTATMLVAVDDVTPQSTSFWMVGQSRATGGRSGRRSVPVVAVLAGALVGRGPSHPSPGPTAAARPRSGRPHDGAEEARSRGTPGGTPNPPRSGPGGGRRRRRGWAGRDGGVTAGRGRLGQDGRATWAAPCGRRRAAPAGRAHQRSTASSGRGAVAGAPARSQAPMRRGPPPAHGRSHGCFWFVWLTSSRLNQRQHSRRRAPSEETGTPRAHEVDVHSTA